MTPRYDPKQLTPFFIKLNERIGTPTNGVLPLTFEAKLRIVKALTKDDAAMRDHLLVIGAERQSGWTRNALNKKKFTDKYTEAEHTERREIAWQRELESYQEMNAMRTKAETLDKIIEMLDLVKVGNKLLGDCTKADLIRAALELESMSAATAVQAVFYRSLAKIIGTATVRGAAGRGEIVALLTHSFT